MQRPGNCRPILQTVRRNEIGLREGNSPAGVASTAQSKLLPGAELAGHGGAAGSIPLRSATASEPTPQKPRPIASTVGLFDANRPTSTPQSSSGVPDSSNGSLLAWRRVEVRVFVLALRLGSIEERCLGATKRGGLNVGNTAAATRALVLDPCARVTGELPRQLTWILGLAPA